MSFVAQHLRAQKIHSMFVVVFSANLTAIKFYEALGAEKLYDRTVPFDGADLKETIYGWYSLNDL